MDLSKLIIDFITAHPWVVSVYLIAAALSFAARATWPEEETRPKWLIFCLAVLDFLNLTFSTPAKALGRKIKGA